MDKIKGYDPLTYWALAALARVSDAYQTADVGELYRMMTMTRVDPDFAEVWKHVDAFEALHTDEDLDALDR